jgi:hypothetical protein
LSKAWILPGLFVSGNFVATPYNIPGSIKGKEEGLGQVNLG